MPFLVFKINVLMCNVEAVLNSRTAMCNLTCTYQLHSTTFVLGKDFIISVENKDNFYSAVIKVPYTVGKDQSFGYICTVCDSKVTT